MFKSNKRMTLSNFYKTQQDKHEDVCESEHRDRRNLENHRANRQKQRGSASGGSIHVKMYNRRSKTPASYQYQFKRQPTPQKVPQPEPTHDELFPSLTPQTSASASASTSTGTWTGTLTSLYAVKDLPQPKPQPRQTKQPDTVQNQDDIMLLTSETTLEAESSSDSDWDELDQ